MGGNCLNLNIYVPAAGCPGRRAGKEGPACGGLYLTAGRIPEREHDRDRSGKTESSKRSSSFHLCFHKLPRLSIMGYLYLGSFRWVKIHRGTGNNRDSG